MYLKSNQLICTCILVWFLSLGVILYQNNCLSLDPSQTTYNILVFICANLNYALDMLLCLTIIGTFQLTSTHLLLVILIFFTRLNVLNERFLSMKYLNRNFFSLSKIFVETLVHVCRTNALHSCVILAVIGTFTPINAYFLVTLLTKQLSLITKILSLTLKK